MSYYGEFTNITGDVISVEVGTTNSKAESAKLLLANSPVTITSTSDGLFAPIKADSATIRILTDKIYADMYANTVNQTKVTVTNKTKSVTLFRGYLTPNIYSQDYTGLDCLELEAVCALSTLKNIKYLKTGEIVSWLDLIKTALLKAGYTSFYLANSYLRTSGSTDALLDLLYQFEDNFFDDDDEKTPWTLYDILEEFCKCFCLSLVVYQAQVYFVDYANTTDYLYYSSSGASGSGAALGGTYTITKKSYKETGAKISYDETYNKISVKDNLYENSNVLPNPMEDLVNQNLDLNKHYEQTKDIDGKNYTYLNAFFSSEKWNNHLIEGEITPSNISTLSSSSFWLKVDSYETETEPSSLNWKTYLTAYNSGGFWGTEFLITSPKELKNMICRGGYFVINMDYKLSNNIYANECFKTSDQKYSNDKYSVDIDNTMFPCRLYLGDYFYDGENWVNVSEYNRKTSKGYYKNVYVGTFNPTPTWYKYKDSDGDWIFTNDKKVWDAATTEKKSGKSDNTNKVYYYEDNGQIFIDEDFYNECLLQDRFYLVHKNREYEKIFDENKSLTNTVSWRMNMVDSEDGVAIKLPNFLINGSLRFELFTPNVLGKYGQYRTDQTVEVAKAVHISQFEILYKVAGSSVNVFDGATLEDDVVYTNVINEDYVNEFDDIEIRINTQVENRITSLSSILVKASGSDFDFLGKIYDKQHNSYKLPEECIIERYYNHYSTPKLILEATLENKLHPLSLVTESSLNTTFAVDSYEIDVDSDNIFVKLIEI